MLRPEPPGVRAPPLVPPPPATRPASARTAAAETAPAPPLRAQRVWPRRPGVCRRSKPVRDGLLSITIYGRVVEGEVPYPPREGLLPLQGGGSRGPGAQRRRRRQGQEGQEGHAAPLCVPPCSRMAPGHKRTHNSHPPTSHTSHAHCESQIAAMHRHWPHMWDRSTPASSLAA